MGWTWGLAWIAAGTASLATVAPTDGQRELAITSSVTGVLGLSATLVQPNTMAGIRGRLDQIDATSTLGRDERRRRAEYALYATAAEEAYWHSWVPHLLGVLVNGGAAAVLIVGFHQTDFGVLQLGLGTFVAECQIWSRPLLASRAWKAYVDAVDAGRPAEVPPDAIDLFSVSLAPTPGGLSVVGSF
jgi:hypothetical protein